MRPKYDWHNRRRRGHPQSWPQAIVGFVLFMLFFSLVLSFSWWWLFGLFWILPWVFGSWTFWDSDEQVNARNREAYGTYYEEPATYGDYYNPNLYEPEYDKRKNDDGHDAHDEYQVTSDGERLRVIDDDGTNRL